MLQIQRTNQFKKELKRQEKRGKKLQKFTEVFHLLIQGKTLPTKYKNHKLTGNCKDRWEFILSLTGYLYMYSGPE